MKQTNIIQLDPKVTTFLEEQPLKMLIGGEWRPAGAGGSGRGARGGRGWWRCGGRWMHRGRILFYIV